MRSIILTILLLSILSIATQWQPASIIPPGTLAINGTSFTADNLRIYCSIYDPYYHADIAYYDWYGSQWNYMGQIQGNVNTTADESQPFITYDGQKLYFMRSIGSTGTYHLWVATWNGSGFYGSTELNPLINSGDCREPSITQDGLKLYFTKGGTGAKIYESIWTVSDWGSPVILPNSVNEPGFGRYDVTISPNGSEIYFTGAYPSPNKLAFSLRIGGIWQQWQYCDSNINQPGASVGNEALTYAPYATQELYFARTNSPGTLTWHALRSPVSVEPASLGQIKAIYR